MSIKELIDKIREGDLTPIEVYEDFYKDWNDDQRWALECSLMAVIVTERREDRCTSSAHKYCSNCYSYLQMRRQEDMAEVEEQFKSKPDAGENEKANKPTDRKIDEKAIGDWLNAQFKGAGNGVINNLPNLLADLQQNRSNKEFAKIALLIHESKYCLVRNLPFSKFYESFCAAVGCNRVQYDPCKLRDEVFARKFMYLQ